eukprot:685963-Pyramimonas_sp.AAC.1
MGESWKIPGLPKSAFFQFPQLVGKDLPPPREATAGGAGDPGEKREEAEERLLKCRDRCAGAMPGPLPLVAKLPVRFADAVGKGAEGQGAFKRAR